MKIWIATFNIWELVANKMKKTYLWAIEEASEAETSSWQVNLSLNYSRKGNTKRPVLSRYLCGGSDYWDNIEINQSLVKSSLIMDPLRQPDYTLYNESC